jgi:hypothetical protein
METILQVLYGLAPNPVRAENGPVFPFRVLYLSRACLGKSSERTFLKRNETAAVLFCPQMIATVYYGAASAVLGDAFLNFSDAKRHF